MLCAKCGKGVTTEERIETPLSELSLITQLGTSSYRFNRGPQLSLPDEVFAWSLFSIGEIVKHQSSHS